MTCLQRLRLHSSITTVLSKGLVPVLIAVRVSVTLHLRQVLRHVSRILAGRWLSAKRLRHLADVIRTVSAAQTHVLNADVD